MIYALVSLTDRAPAHQLYWLAKALEINARHCAEAWEKVAPAVVVADREAGLPAGAIPVLFVDESADPGTLAVHYFDPLKSAPAARVYCMAGSGFNTGTNSVCEAASHEVLEALIDPRVNLWLDHPEPAREGVQMALEVCDPVQDHYEIEVPGSSVKWRVSNFVTPYYFVREFITHPEWMEKGLKYDFLGTLSRPGSIGPDGYAVLRRRDGSKWTTWAEDSFGSRAALASHKSDAMGRLRRLGVQA